MAQSLIHYNIFLASPSDVSEERQLIETSINELNSTVCRTLNIRLDLVKWETDSYPSVATYSQDVINQQINEYDFFIGVMWSKVGSPTPNYSSGTIEEFQIAYDKFNRGSDIKILFYFSNKAIPTNEIEPEQIIELNKFKKELGDKGVYYQHYSKPEEFQSLVKLHISQHLNEVNAKKKLKESLETQSLDTINTEIHNDSLTINEFEDLGLLEYLEIFKECFVEVESAIERLASYITELGTNISKRGERITSYNEMPFDTSRDLKKEIERAAKDMIDYVKRTDVEIPIFHEHYYKGMEALSNALTIQEEDGTISLSELQSLSETLGNNYEVFNTTISQIEGFKDNVRKIPRVTASIKNAKVRIDQTLANLVSELDSSQNLSEEFKLRVDNLIDSFAVEK